MVAEKEDESTEAKNELEDEQEDNETKIKCEYDELLKGALERYNLKVEQREKLLDPDRSSKSKVKLDSSIKKNSAFVKKLATIKETQVNNPKLSPEITPTSSEDNHHSTTTLSKFHLILLKFHFDFPSRFRPNINQIPI